MIEMLWPALAAWGAAFAFGYALGAIPFGLLITRLAGTPDIRAIGSGNIGATNVLRTGRKGLAAATLVCDALKGTVAVLAASRIAQFSPAIGAGWEEGEAAIAAALGAFLGHLFPVWLGFRGGKGVATFIGLSLAFAWPAALGFCAVWLAVAALTRYSSLSALNASAATPALVWYFGRPSEAALFAFLAALLWIRHRANIARLLAGTEGKIGAAPERASSQG
jgi:acyl phosphate:glycerol-3-phosphate acyltransferase